MSRESHFQVLNHHQIKATFFTIKKVSGICDFHRYININIKYGTFPREHLVSNVFKKAIGNNMFPVCYEKIKRVEERKFHF